MTPECLSPEPSAHQASRFTDVTDDLNIANDTVPEDGLRMPEMLARLKNLTPEGDILVTKLKDPPLFMFSSISGKTREIQIFYDGGNSHCLFKMGVPTELWGCLTKRGAHALGAVGATKVYGGDAWACQPMTISGKREILVRIEVAQITTDFPTIDLSEAAASLKASKPEDAALQDLKPPSMVGGQVDILLGIQYLAHFPRLVHSLDNGLSIFEVRLTPSSPEVTAAIAGPHHSFNLILEQVGTRGMLSAFKRGVGQWNTSGPPSLSHLPLATHDAWPTTDSDTQPELVKKLPNQASRECPQTLGHTLSDLFDIPDGTFGTFGASPF
jgi:hypothetical protein